MISHQNELAAWDENLKGKSSDWKIWLLRQVMKMYLNELQLMKRLKINHELQILIHNPASLIPDWNDVKIEWNKIESFSWKTEERKQIIELDEQNSSKKIYWKKWL